MNRVDFTLTQAQVQALHTTPVQLIAAPGATSGIIPMFLAIYKSSATAYGGGSLVNLAYTNGMSDNVTFNTTAAPLLTTSGLGYLSTDLTMLVGSGVALTTNVVNKPIFIYSTAAITGSGGVVKGTIFYSIVAIS